MKDEYVPSSEAWKRVARWFRDKYPDYAGKTRDHEHDLKTTLDILQHPGRVRD
jgi:hypothetical protein